MSKYAIVFFPRSGTGHIQNFRKIYDPKAALIPPHLTLVFPFPVTSDSTILIEEIAAKLKKYRPFEAELEGCHLDTEDHFLHLVITKGREEIAALHDDLYTGLLETYWRKDLPYNPHVTIGVFTNADRSFDEEKYKEAQQSLEEHDLHASFNFDNVQLIEIRDANTPRAVVKSFDLQ